MPKQIPRREDYRHFISVPTRWADQDALQHVNNAVYYMYFDTAVASFLYGTGILDDHDSPVTAVVVETCCRHHSPAFFPEVLSVGLRVAHIGTSSVRYEIGIFRPEQETACAEGHFIHVHVDRREMSQTRPVPEALRVALAPLMVSPAG
ncbi:acyl-CoA thioesterase [Roseomonas marmotae]|uniref:Acyl-CoA thioesterase n=1 Tax=Roseomonas marmotae TaxID=2768161 RepID=A0ABS3K9Z7_9PROT|nr:thioesterase family protein [Roseomonas marmotae]MBO1074289.1 acyl-CoA thioesterase [Roseomonas marmotae]QTI78043.1 acyl-CoA thioesterase [Roseomonas marmotae]